MPNRQVLLIDKETDTLADTLKAVGVAEVIAAWYRVLGITMPALHLIERSGWYDLELSFPLDAITREAVTTPFTAGRGLFMLTEGQQKVPPQDLVEKGFPYATLQAQKAAYRDFRWHAQPGHARRRSGKPPGEPFPDPPPAHPDLDLYACINTLGATSRYNALWLQWYRVPIERFRLSLQTLLHLFAQHPNPLQEVLADWQRLGQQHPGAGPTQVPRLQVVNPVAGKGGYAPKAGTLHLDNPHGFWLLEYLKFVGFFTCAIPVSLSNGDRTLYVLQPPWCDLTALRESVITLRATLKTTSSAKANHLTLLHLAQLQFSQQSPMATATASRSSAIQNTPDATPLATPSPRVEVARFKDMGTSSYALMSLSTLQLPRWLQTSAMTDEITAAQQMLQEHLQVLTTLGQASEKFTAEELLLLQAHGDFLSGHDWLQFLEFAARYGPYALASRKRGQWRPYLSRTGLEYLMSLDQPHPSYARIVTNPGFEAFATAIRRAVISPQYWSVRDRRYPYQPQLQLGQQLLDAAEYPDLFLRVLTLFSKTYNADNIRVDTLITKHQLSKEQRYQRPWLRKDHLDEVMTLLDEVPASLLGHLLLAYGYAWLPHPANAEIPDEGRAGSQPDAPPEAESAAPTEFDQDQGKESQP